MARAAWFQEVFSNLREHPRKVLEVGCGCGANFAALYRVDPGIQAYGVEPNFNARAQAFEQAPQAHVFSGSADEIPGAVDSEFDLVMTCGVLIHIPNEGLPDAMGEIHRVAKRFILCAEYYGREVEGVPYRGEDGALWRRPYGDLWMKQFPDLKPLAQGFAWKRTMGLDDLCWFLFEKP